VSISSCSNGSVFSVLAIGVHTAVVRVPAVAIFLKFYFSIMFCKLGLGLEIVWGREGKGEGVEERDGL